MVPWTHVVGMQGYMVQRLEHAKKSRSFSNSPTKPRGWTPNGNVAILQGRIPILRDDQMLLNPHLRGIV